MHELNHLLNTLFYYRTYLENIGIVDRGIRALVDVIEESFDRDNRTAYVFTSDHGMTDWGKILFVHLPHVTYSES